MPDLKKGKWAVLFTYHWGKSLIRVAADFYVEEDADTFYKYCKKNKLSPRKKFRTNIVVP